MRGKKVGGFIYTKDYERRLGGEVLGGKSPANARTMNRSQGKKNEGQDIQKKVVGIKQRDSD